MASTKKISLREWLLFALFGVLLFLGQLITEAIPNVHPVALFLTVITVVYRSKALIPLAVYVFLEGLFGGFGVWWVPYLYMWLPLWALVMLVPRTWPPFLRTVFYTLIATVHGLLFGLMYAPFQALAWHLDLAGMWAWVIAGIPYDLLHAAGNFCFSLFSMPLIRLLETLEKSHRKL